MSSHWRSSRIRRVSPSCVSSLISGCRSPRRRCPRLAVPESGKESRPSGLLPSVLPTPSVLPCASVVPDLPSLAHPFDSHLENIVLFLFSQEISGLKILFGSCHPLWWRPLPCLLLEHPLSSRRRRRALQHPLTSSSQPRFYCPPVPPLDAVRCPADCLP